MKQILWNQFGASLDMLENAVRDCPDEIWTDGSGPFDFWYLAYHTLFWTDLYLHGPVEGFSPAEPFGLEELDPDGMMPPRIYSRIELLEYLAHCREKLREGLNRLTHREMSQIITHGEREMSREELLWYTMRHVQHHTAQLNYILRMKAGFAPKWVSITSHPLN